MRKYTQCGPRLTVTIITIALPFPYYTGHHHSNYFSKQCMPAYKVMLIHTQIDCLIWLGNTLIKRIIFNKITFSML